MEKIKSAIMGVIIGDALGLPVQFKQRSWFLKNPVKTMTGPGVFNKPKGSWSDDGSLTLALADSLAHGYDPQQIMRAFEAWLFYGKYTQDGIAYDIGQTTLNAIMNYHRGIPLDKCGGRSYYDNGNGSLMRILPLVFYLRKRYGTSFTASAPAMAIIHEVSALTHAHELAKMSCGIYLAIANELIDDLSIPAAIESGYRKAMDHYKSDPRFDQVAAEYARLKNLEIFIRSDEKTIGSSGFVKDTLQAALWCLLNTHSYEEAVLKAVNLGHDTDTTAAVTGGLAALAYGKIAQEWSDLIHHEEIIILICDALEKSLI